MSLPFDHPKRCPVCMGEGQIDEGNSYAPNSRPKLKACNFCKGTGEDPRKATDTTEEER